MKKMVTCMVALGSIALFSAGCNSSEESTPAPAKKAVTEAQKSEKVESAKPAAEQAAVKADAKAAKAVKAATDK